MKARLIDGKILAANFLKNLKRKVLNLKLINNIEPGLAIIQVGNNPSSNIYITNKIKKCAEIGIKHSFIKFKNNIEEYYLLKSIEELNLNPNINGIIVQLPLPAHLNSEKIISSIAENKDADGLHPNNFGRMLKDIPALLPCTPQGCIFLIKSQIQDLTGKKVLVIGRSNIVGKPLSYMLLKENCTVTIAHYYTKNLKNECQKADIVVVAIGVSKFIKADWFKKTAIVIDVGINSVEIEKKNIITGDVDFINTKEQVAAITPVPGGVGPMTIAFLLQNTVLAACSQNNISFEDL